ncbi:DUF3540 domain-containing protein [Taylorella asinigenitalis]|uniref:Uncharacterized protein n=1 Tax=Taylorella asinigenitalis (strain MCE3) TaxID=1008459 RepID=G4QD88_TAYAM|nr:DUF3540 domain-containing protein [Taylorella asinigenitalis]AEP35905.1 hypothetical protein TASI_0114 [Taylorella asinigenitalis MCE3]
MADKNIKTNEKISIDFDFQDGFGNSLKDLLDRDFINQEKSTIGHRAKVISIDSSNLYTVLIDNQIEIKCKRSVSCLIKPVLGDVVLVNLDKNKFEDNYILYILDRDNVNLSYEVDLNLTFTSPCLKVSSALFSISSKRMSVKTQDYKLLTSNFEATTQNFNVYSNKLNFLANYSYKTVIYKDELRAMNFDHTATGIAKLSGNLTYVQGNEVLKYDGKLMLAG